MNIPETLREDAAWKAAFWLQIEMGLHCKIHLHLSTSSELNCWGVAWPHEEEQNTYCVSVAEDQSLRDFIATIAHEMIHVKQWVQNKYLGDGEEEAEENQYELADEMWKGGVI